MMDSDDEYCLTEELADNHLVEILPVISSRGMGDEAHCISFHALTSQLVPSILKLEGTIQRQQVVVLIDGSLTNNFIQSHLATHLGLAVQPSQYLRVTFYNNEALSYI